MDLDTITDYRPAPGAAWQPGDAWLGGGTWLFSEPQPGLRRLLDLRAFGWAPLAESRGVLEIAATCTIGELAEAPFNLMAPALANAVRDATGVRITDLPMSPDRVYLALRPGPAPAD
jgi:hypothetical protein